MNERQQVGWSPEDVAVRAAAELEDGEYVNLGIGLPTRLLDVVPADGREVIFHSENGILGITGVRDGDTPDGDLVDAGKAQAAIVDGGCFFDHADSFSMIRGGHIDTAIIGAYEVAANGDLANWSSSPLEEIDQEPRVVVPAVGGAVDLAAGAGRVIVLMKSASFRGQLRLVRECSLPLTGRGCVDLVICDLGLLRPYGGAFVLEEVAPGVDEALVAAQFAGQDVPLIISDAVEAASTPGEAHVS